MSKPLILVTNDDGIEAKGIKELIDTIVPLGDIIVFAPDGPRSGMSNAITVNTPLRFKKIEMCDNVLRFACNGTPTDCVKLALHSGVLHRKPDILLSGINHGSNAAINVIYSGTMGAAFEGCENSIPSIGFSLANYDGKADFNFFKPYIIKIVKEVLKHGLPRAVCLNVNAPIGEVKGLKITRQAWGYWTDEFEKRIDPNGHSYYWMSGYFKNEEPANHQTDEWALANGYVSIVPSIIDLTAHDFVDEMKTWNL
ncbi:MAG: 5'/3'-nucleotidase SurE [Paludibacter sp.]|nr:5'/3'-nucleotidase SurE [Paludibacter sp.]